MSTIIKKLLDMTRNRKLAYVFCFEARRNIPQLPQVNYGNKPTTRANVDACSQEYSGYHSFS